MSAPALFLAMLPNPASLSGEILFCLLNAGGVTAVDVACEKEPAAFLSALRRLRIIGWRFAGEDPGIGYSGHFPERSYSLCADSFALANAHRPQCERWFDAFAKAERPTLH